METFKVFIRNRHGSIIGTNLVTCKDQETAKQIVTSRNYLLQSYPDNFTIQAVSRGLSANRPETSLK